MNITIGQLRKEIIDEFSSHWKLNDEAHRIEHFSEVEGTAFYINEKLNLGIDPKLITLAAFFHDLFAWSRNNHHELSYQYVSTTNHRFFTSLDITDRMAVAYGCLHHRASFDGVFVGAFDELINSADRGFPSQDVTPIVERSINYTKAKYSDRNVICQKVFEHMGEKFGSNGYARYPDMYSRVFEEELKQQRSNIDKLTLEDVLSIYDNMMTDKKIKRIADETKSLLDNYDKFVLIP